MTSAPSAIAIVPAAGKSERFGSMKLLADVGGQPLIARTLQSLLDAGVPRVIVVCAPAPFGTVELFQDGRIELATNPDPSRGMFSTIQAGLAFAAGDDTVVVIPADMPFVTPSTIVAVIDACRRTNAPVAASFQNRHGHPLALPSRLRDMLLDADPTRPLKEALTAAGEAVAELDVDDPGVVRDVDTRTDLDQPH
jgi:molybdenum cofactor cytidylyltransferase